MLDLDRRREQCYVHPRPAKAFRLRRSVVFCACRNVLHILVSRTLKRMVSGRDTPSTTRMTMASSSLRSECPPGTSVFSVVAQCSPRLAPTAPPIRRHPAIPLHHRTSRLSLTPCCSCDNGRPFRLAIDSAPFTHRRLTHPCMRLPTTAGSAQSLTRASSRGRQRVPTRPTPIS